MKRLNNFRSAILLLAGLAAGMFLGSSLFGLQSNPFVLQAHAQPTTDHTPVEDGTQTDLRSINDRLPDQAHAMADVGYHFANLWFAADKQNWPLANYYLSETRSHLKWAVRIHPVRKISTGVEVNLNGILDAVDGGLLAEVGRAITNKDTAKFKASYQQTLQGCYACHAACEKPFLRPQVPTAIGAPIIGFDPNTASPE